MKGWVVLAVAALAACSSKSNGGGAGGSDSGSDSSECPCVVQIDDAGTTASVACRQHACVGDAYYYCSAEGTPYAMGACPPVEDEAGAFDAGCTPSCPQGSCGIDDGCGKLCTCSSGLTCQNNVCGNGCAGVAGDYCGFGGDASTSCCQVGLTCAMQGDAAASTCCAGDGIGTCTKDTDCCNYPNVHCDLGSGGPDASKATHTCIP